VIRIGTVLYGFCGGYFARDLYGDKRVEAVGADWIVVREIDSGKVDFAYGDGILATLEGYTTPPEETE
jgi:hypothetical protein